MNQLDVKVIGMNFKLFKAIRSQGLRQRDFAVLVGDHESIVSRVINGIWNPDDMRKIRYAKALKMKVEDLF
jgi:transcriptional regulator with XRE-family HTH domain